MCDQGLLDIVIDPGTAERRHRDGVWCDPCIAPLVRALNAGGLRTVSSCCGHGRFVGSVALADGRWVHLSPDNRLAGMRLSHAKEADR